MIEGSRLQHSSKFQVSKKSTNVFEKEMQSVQEVYWCLWKKDAKCPRSLILKKRYKASKKSTDVYEKEMQSVQEVY